MDRICSENNTLKALTKMNLQFQVKEKVLERGCFYVPRNSKNLVLMVKFSHKVVKTGTIYHLKEQ